MKVSNCALAFALTLGSSARTARAAGGSKFYYDHQEDWPTVAAPSGTSNECARVDASGVGQSPIDIERGDCGSGTEGYQFFEGDCTLGDYTFSINDHGVKAELSALATCTKPTMSIPGIDKVYDVWQFHIHTGCEHTFDSEGCDAELHIVHIAQTPTDAQERASDSLPDLAVVGMTMFGGDTHHDTIDPLLDSWSAISCGDNCDATLGAQNANTTFAPYQMLTSGTNFYHYTGSLTTPPCWEIVTWNVAESPVMVSWRQILSLSNLINHYTGFRGEDGTCQEDSPVTSAAGLSGRATQPLKGRQVEKICTPYVLSK